MSDTAAPQIEVIEGTDIPDVFDPQKLYDVQLHTAFYVGSLCMSPSKKQTLRGDVCEEHRAKIWKAVVNDSGVQELK